MERWPARQIASVSGCCCCWWCWCFTTHKVHRTAICTWCLVLASARLPLMLLLLPHTFICLMARAWTLWRREREREREREHESELQVGFGVAWAVCQVVQKQQLLYSVSLCSSRCSSRPSEFTWLGSHQNKRTNRQTESTVAQAAVHASADGAARARCHCHRHQARRQRRGEALNASVCEGVHR